MCLPRSNLILPLLFCLLFSFCVNKEPVNEESQNCLVNQESPKVGEIPPSNLEIEDKGSLVANNIKSLISLSPPLQDSLENLGISREDLQYDVQLYKIIYDTTYLGNIIRASAMIAVPDKTGPLGLVAVQHGTFFANEEVPSEWISPTLANFANLTLENLVMEGLPDSMVGGYLSVSVDYLGFGESHNKVIRHPYLNCNSYPQDIISALRATKDFVRDKNIVLQDKLFLRGYSEGAFATLATQRVIESDELLKNEFPITAVAAGAGPYDLLYTASTLLRDPSVELLVPSYLPYVYFGAEQVYGKEYNWSDTHINNFLKTDTVAMRKLFNGEHTRNVIEMEMSEGLLVVPKLISALFQAEALKSWTVSNNSDAVINETTEPNSIFRIFNKVVLQDNSLNFGWTPNAPLRLYHCEDDKIVPPGNSTDRASGLVDNNKISLKEHAILNKNVSGYVTQSDHGHSPCPLYALPIKEWFDKFQAE